MKKLSNEELIEQFENLNFNQGFNSAKGYDSLSLSPKEVYEMRLEILKRMD